MHLLIAYHARLRVTKARVDDVIEFSDRYYQGLGSGSQFDNDYDFLKECLIASRIL